MSHWQPIEMLPEPDHGARSHSDRLLRHIRDEIIVEGAMDFSRFMELALYAPDLGYYSTGQVDFGVQGDFTTAPEVSSLFGRCLARQCLQVIAHTGGGVLEFGAGSGALAVALLNEVDALSADLPAGYAILEPSAALRQRQYARIEAMCPHWLSRIIWLESLPDTWQGVMLGNEMLDAMPVQRFCIHEGAPWSLSLGWEREEGLIWREQPGDEALVALTDRIEQAIGCALPEGYVSEWNRWLGPWMNAAAERLQQGLLLLIDYGYPRREYYHPQRNQGTLLCHYRHRVHEDPLRWPGLQDITASVDFSAVAEAGIDGDLELSGFCHQAGFLLGCGLDRILGQSDPEDAANHLPLVQQAKRLTMPGEMGDRFKAIALTRGLDIALDGFTFQDERHRLW